MSDAEATLKLIKTDELKRRCVNLLSLARHNPEVEKTELQKKLDELIEEAGTLDIELDTYIRATKNAIENR